MVNLDHIDFIHAEYFTLTVLSSNPCSPFTGFPVEELDRWLRVDVVGHAGDVDHVGGALLVQDLDSSRRNWKRMKGSN